MKNDVNRTTENMSRVFKLIGEVRKKYDNGEYCKDDVNLREIKFDND